MNEEYLGDSVYVSFDGYNLELTTKNGLPTENGLPTDSSNRIILEPEVQVAFIKYIERIIQNDKRA